MSSSKTSSIAYFIYEPISEIKAVVQLSHGMCEYIERYEHFASFLTQNGIVLAGNDHLGHGKSVQGKEQLGYFAPKDGWTYLSQDLNKLTLHLKKKYPNLPFFLIGHSMGSFIARDYLVKYNNQLNGAVIMGTSGINPKCKLAIIISKLISMISGEKHRSRLIHNGSFKGYNDTYPDKQSEFDWLTRDRAVVEWYQKNDYCNFIFTASGFHDLFTLLNHVSSPRWAEKVDNTLPMLLLSGKDDPVGQYGKGTEQVYHWLKNSGQADLSIQLFDKGRHELINETNKDDVYQVILDWILTHI